MVHRLVALVRRQVASDRGEGATQVFGAAHEHDATVVGDVEPFVSVGRPRINVTEALDEMRATRISERPETERAVDMAPAFSLARPSDDVGEGIERARVDLARLGTDDHRTANVGEIATGAKSSRPVNQGLT